MDPKLEIHNARTWLHQTDHVGDLIAFWMLYGPMRTYSCPEIEKVPGAWHKGLTLRVV